MVKTQYPYIDEHGKPHGSLEKHYSTKGLRILQVETGEEYDDAVDVRLHRNASCPYTYIETDKPIETK